MSKALEDAFGLLGIFAFIICKLRLTMTSEHDTRAIKRVFLFSDGCANLGITSLDGIVKIIQKMQVTPRH